ncbi:Putative metalloproteinase inhibitor [Toxocara canis]|uniref:Putative metalloproteinase inhibitor n=1 Tax=Toxocara canis TaxID=6265 RepID=A0A0B2UXF4_TOXCA|nr:Putative metalloproteinase inhibitor [Toxocara canis]
MGQLDLNELAKKRSASFLLPLTSALSDKLQAVQPLVDRLDKVIKLMSENQSSAIQCCVEPQLYSVMAKMMQMDRNKMNEKNERAVYIGTPHVTTEDATKEDDEQMLREAINACDSRQLSESHMKLLGAAILATILAVSTACSCVALTPQEAYDGAQWVSRVLIVSKREEIVSDFEQFIIYTVHYITVFKNIKRKRHLCTEMRTPKETATCGVPFLEPGKEYLLAGSFDDSDEPTINNCLQILGPGNIPEWKGVPSEIKTKLKAGAFDSTLQR